MLKDGQCAAPQLLGAQNMLQLTKLSGGILKLIFYKDILSNDWCACGSGCPIADVLHFLL